MCWITHKTLFDNNPDTKIMDLIAPYFHRHLLSISQAHSYLQICKLHDPAKTANSYNLSISYIINKITWNDQGKLDSSKRLAEKLEKLNSCINPVRNKIIAHNDRDILLQDDPLGAFPAGIDEEYFQCLQEFVNQVHGEFVGGPYPFSECVINYANEYLSFLKHSDLANRRLNPPASRSRPDRREPGCLRA